MAVGIGDIARAFVCLVALAAGVLLLALASPGASTAEASACSRWGDVSPKKLSNGQARDAIRCLINNERQRRGLPGLDRHKKLQKAAQRHNERMDGTGCFSHQCNGEGSLDARLRSVGYLRGGLSRWAYGENIAWGGASQGTPESIVEAWMNSPGHRDNILSSTFEDIGVGFSSGTPGSKGAAGGIYTTDFGLAEG
jgi:uncharacterized protein YkwD